MTSDGPTDIGGATDMGATDKGGTDRLSAIDIGGTDIGGTWTDMGPVVSTLSGSLIGFGVAGGIIISSTGCCWSGNNCCCSSTNGCYKININHIKIFCKPTITLKVKDFVK